MDENEKRARLLLVSLGVPETEINILRVINFMLNERLEEERAVNGFCHYSAQDEDDDT